MANRNIAFINASTCVSDQEAIQVMNALQIQVTRDFEPVWGESATLHFFSRNQQVPQGYWWLVIVDYNEESSNMGWHDVSSEGLPQGMIPAKADKEFGYQWSVTASHELLEIIEDPGINLCARRYDRERGADVLYAYEVCDPCEAEEQGYLINGVLVSDFVFPEYFEDFIHPEGTRYDFMGYITKPFELLEQGYLSINDSYKNAAWEMEYFDDESITYRMRPYRGSRRDRRRTSMREWMRSSPNF